MEAFHYVSGTRRGCRYCSGCESEQYLPTITWASDRTRQDEKHIRLTNPFSRCITFHRSENSGPVECQKQSSSTVFQAVIKIVLSPKCALSGMKDKIHRLITQVLELSHCLPVWVLAAPLQLQLPVDMFKKAVEDGLNAWALTHPLGKTLLESQTPGFSLVQPWPLRLFGEWPSRWRNTLCCPFPGPQLCLSNK